MRSSVSLVALASLLLGGPTLLGGCAENNQSFYIVGNTAFNNQCQLDPSLTLSSGVLDMVIGESYWMFPQIVNDMPSSIVMKGYTAADGRLEAHNIFLKKANIQYEYGSRNITLQNFQEKSYPLSGMVGPRSHSVLGVEVMPWDMVQTLNAKLTSATETYPSARLMINLQLQGEMSDGTEISSNVFSYPIVVCRGCLLSFPAAADDDQLPGRDCNDLSQAINSVPCYPGQDAAIDCRICKQTKPQLEQDECDPR